jgi:hypothetical protein
MARYQIVTLVDITRSQPTREETDKIKLGQQANFNSLVQAIGMRSNVTWHRDPTKHTGRLPEPASGKATHWTWEFDCERDQVFLKDKDPVGLLKFDLDGVPIVAGLGDSIELAPACFFSQGDRINTWIREIS